MKLYLDVTAITVERRQNRTGIAEKEVERQNQMSLATKQLMVGTNFTDFVIPL